MCEHSILVHMTLCRVDIYTKFSTSLLCTWNVNAKNTTYSNTEYASTKFVFVTKYE